MKLIKWIDENEGEDIRKGWGVVCRSDTRFQYKMAIMPLCYILRSLYLIHHWIINQRDWERIIHRTHHEGYKIGVREGMSKNQNNLEAYNLGLEAGKESSKRKG